MKPLALVGIIGVTLALLGDFAIFLWQYYEYEAYRPAEAKVIGLSYVDLSGKGRYARTLIVDLLVSTDRGDVLKRVSDGDSQMRPQYAHQTKPGDRVIVWVNKKTDETKLFMPDVPKLFSHLKITLPTIGLIAAAISTIFWGKEFVRNER